MPYVRGPERSRATADILGEVRGLAADGVREVTLLGQNVNAYGLDLRRAGAADAADFAALLRAIDAQGGVARVRFMTSHPKDLSDELVDAIAGLPSVCEHVHLPLQAGSDRVLAAMRRSYTAAAYLERVAALRERGPRREHHDGPDRRLPRRDRGGLRRDPGRGPRGALRRGLHVRLLGARGHRRRRASRSGAGRRRAGNASSASSALTQDLALAAHRGWVGRRAEVLVEGPSRHGDGLRGRTRQNVTVNFAGDAEPGAIVEVEIEAATSTTLRGRPTPR